VLNFNFEIISTATFRCEFWNPDCCQPPPPTETRFAGAGVLSA